MSVEITIKGEVVTAYLTGELDHHNAAGIREKIDGAIDSNMPSLLVLDFGGVSFMDSSGIGLIMGRYRCLQKHGAKMHITGASPQIEKVMKLAGMNRLASIN
ncbi:MAG: STAS domain-containing protein [Clostridia bacterium]|nr:STAS domain-containing protein [Clostridia bacterium]